MTRLDYCSATLTGLPRQLLDGLQSVMNTAARLVSCTIMSLRYCVIFTGCVCVGLLQIIEYRLTVLATWEWLHRTCHRHSGVRLTLFPDDTSVVNDNTGRVYRTKRSIIGDRACPVAAACAM